MLKVFFPLLGVGFSDLCAENSLCRNCAFSAKEQCLSSVGASSAPLERPRSSADPGAFSGFGRQIALTFCHSIVNRSINEIVMQNSIDPRSFEACSASPFLHRAPVRMPPGS